MPARPSPPRRRQFINAALVASCVAAGCGGGAARGHDACVTSADCLGGNVCSVDRCVPGTFAPDWTSGLTAVYRFEEGTSNLGADSSGHGHDLTGGGDAHPIPSLTFKEGKQSAELRTATSFLSSTADFPAVTDQGLVVGGWFLLDRTKIVSTKLVNRGADVSKFDLLFEVHLDNPNQTLNCDVAGSSRVVSTLDTSAFDTWAHLVCRFDQLAVGSIFANGVPLSPIPSPGSVPGPLASALTLGCDYPNCYVGNMDEVFYKDGPLTDLQITRIWACGVDGKLCICQPSDPTRYTDCGRAKEAGCAQLGDCNAPAP